MDKRFLISENPFHLKGIPPSSQCPRNVFPVRNETWPTEVLVQPLALLLIWERGKSDILSLVGRLLYMFKYFLEPKLNFSDALTKRGKQKQPASVLLKLRNWCCKSQHVTPFIFLCFLILLLLLSVVTIFTGKISVSLILMATAEDSGTWTPHEVTKCLLTVSREIHAFATKDAFN